ncbi:MAG: hypothetical protein WBF90_32650 [Rivularia sp. (in: cyanobacteria)]
MYKFESNIKATSNKQKLTALNEEKLNTVLCYFSQLYANREIDNKDFEILVRHACSIFIENQVEIVVEETLERKIMAFLSYKLAV